MKRKVALRPLVRHSPDEPVSDAQAALRYLQEGNRRYVENRALQHPLDIAFRREVMAKPQHPLAVIVTCADSRVQPERFFDQGFGDIFVVRHAGNIADNTTLGTIEYAVRYLGAPLVVVVGHSQCGAVTAAYEGGDYPACLQQVTDTIRANIQGAQTLDEAIYANLNATAQSVRKNQVVREDHVAVLGAYYDIVSGVVTFLEN
ncbi:MAG: carbonic anhydrase [Oscillospiraceae bacterium]|nr:carbonic anhydrase [Oscillospiraceae bacterium]